MKQEHSKEGIEKLTRLFGKTRHAYYDHLWRSKKQDLKDELILHLVHEIREDLARLGTRKLHFLINQRLIEHKLIVGRDYLFDLLAEYKLLIRNRRRKVITTNSRHWMHKYSNLIKDLQVSAPEQLWVSDITYIRLNNGFIYLSLITDAYSHRVLGYHPGKDLSADGCLIALKMALTNRQYNKPLIHHSDRGSQYCSKLYVDLEAV